MRPLVVGLTLSLILIAGCASSTPEVPAGPDGSPDPVLVAGREVYTDRCANCHGSAGGGDRGPKIVGDETLEDFPEVADLVELIEAGKGSMPGFGDELSGDELEAVARFIREVL